MARTRRNYVRATKPADIGTTCITAKGGAPSAEVHSKRATLETQWTSGVTRKALRGGGYLWAKTGPVSRDHLYCITVKVYNAKAQDYWLPYAKAAELWFDVTGLDLQDELRHDNGLGEREDVRDSRGFPVELDEDTESLLDELFARFN